MKKKQQSKIEGPKEQKIIHRIYQEPKIRNKQRNLKENKKIDTLKKKPHTFSYAWKCVCECMYYGVCECMEQRVDKELN